MKTSSVSAPGRRSCPVSRLADLNLSSEEIGALRCQGTVCQEIRKGIIYFKLRFRTVEGLQRVRYLGKDPVTAAKIQEELRELQFRRQQSKTLRHQDAQARQLLRQVKRLTGPLIEELGLYYHGNQIRRRCGRTET